MFAGRNEVKSPGDCVNVLSAAQKPAWYNWYRTAIGKISMRSCACQSREQEDITAAWDHLETERRAESVWVECGPFLCKNCEVWALKHRFLQIISGSQHCWMTVRVYVCVHYFPTLLTELANLSGCSYTSTLSILSLLRFLALHPLILRCRGATLCRRLIIRVAVGRAEGRSSSGSDSCLYRSANCRRTLPSVSDKCQVTDRSDVTTLHSPPQLKWSPGKMTVLLVFSISALPLRRHATSSCSLFKTTAGEF